MVIKQIIFNEQTGKLYLSDSDNNHYLCDIYGVKRTTFLPNITGCCNSNQRQLKMNIISNNKLKDLTFINESGHNLNSNPLRYMPSTRKFEGYFQFPSPLSPPFSNLRNNKNKEKLISHLKKYFKGSKNVFNAESLGLNKGLAYLTHSVSKDYSKTDRDNLLQLINIHFDEYRENNKYKLNLMSKDPTIKALKRLKQVLLENEDMTVVNGRKLPSPSDEIKEKYQKIEKLLSGTNRIEDINLTITRNEKNSNIVVEKDELSFLSVESDNEVKYRKANLGQIKSLFHLNKNLEKEKLLINGFKENPIKDEGIIRKNIKLKLKSNGELFSENMKLLEKVNPIAFELRRKKDEYDKRELEKKRNQKVIYQKNIGF